MEARLNRIACTLVASSPPRTLTLRPQALQGPQLGGPKPSKDTNLEAPDLEFCSPLQHFSYFFDKLIFPFQDMFGPLFWSTWRLLGLDLDAFGHLLGQCWGFLGTTFGLQGAPLGGLSALGCHFRAPCLPRAEIWRPKGPLRIQSRRPKRP